MRENTQRTKWTHHRNGKLEQQIWLNILVNATTAELKYLANYKVANPANNQGIKLRDHNTIITQRGHEFS